MHAGWNNLLVKMRETLGYVALDFDEQNEEASTSSKLERGFELPDGERITIGKERFNGPEILFNPELMGSDEPSMH